MIWNYCYGCFLLGAFTDCLLILTSSSLSCVYIYVYLQINLDLFHMVFYVMVVQADESKSARMNVDEAAEVCF